MAKYKYIVIWEVPINVNAIRREPGEKFIEEETQEMKNLVTHGYVLKIKKVKEEK